MIQFNTKIVHMIGFAKISILSLHINHDCYYLYIVHALTCINQIKNNKLKKFFFLRRYIRFETSGFMDIEILLFFYQLLDGIVEYNVIRQQLICLCGAVIEL